MSSRNDKVIAQEVLEMTHKYGNTVFYLSQDNLAKDGKVDTANLLRSGIVINNSEGSEIIYSAPYSDNVEYGREAGTMPPVGPIVGWVKRRLGISNEKEARRIAFAVAKSIQKRGIEAARFLRNAADQANSKFDMKVN